MFALSAERAASLPPTVISDRLPLTRSFIFWPLCLNKRTRPSRFTLVKVTCARHFTVRASVRSPRLAQFIRQVIPGLSASRAAILPATEISDRLPLTRSFIFLPLC